METIVVTIPAYNRPEVVRETLNVLSEEMHLIAGVVVSIDANESRKSNWLKLEKDFSGNSLIKFIYHTANLGAYANAKFCLSADRMDDFNADYLFFCEDDIVPKKNLLKCLLHIAKVNAISDLVAISATGVRGYGEFFFYSSYLVPAWGMLLSKSQLTRFDITPISRSEARYFTKSVGFNLRLFFYSPFHFIVWYKFIISNKNLSYGDISVLFRNVYYCKKALIPTYTLIDNCGFDATANQMLSKYATFFKDLELKSLPNFSPRIRLRPKFDIWKFTFRRWRY